MYFCSLLEQSTCKSFKKTVPLIADYKHEKIPGYKLVKTPSLQAAIFVVIMKLARCDFFHPQTRPRLRHAKEAGTVELVYSAADLEAPPPPTW